MGATMRAKTVILCTGTFLGGCVVVGEIQYPGGRQGEPGAPELSRSLECGFICDGFRQQLH